MTLRQFGEILIAGVCGGGVLGLLGYGWFF
jgi:hypothetical protein